MLKLLVEVSVPSATISAVTMAKTILASYSTNAHAALLHGKTGQLTWFESN